MYFRTSEQLRKKYGILFALVIRKKYGMLFALFPIAN